jgi:hypothetical protein
MKFLSTTILVVFCLAAFMAMAENSHHRESGMIRILQNVLTDPEFLQLNKQQQLGVLIATYQLLEQHYKKNHNYTNKVFSF